MDVQNAGSSFLNFTGPAAASTLAQILLYNLDGSNGDYSNLTTVANPAPKDLSMVTDHTQGFIASTLGPPSQAVTSGLSTPTDLPQQGAIWASTVLNFSVPRTTESWLNLSTVSYWDNTSAWNTTIPDSQARSVVEILVISVIVAVVSIVTAGGNLMVMISFKMDKQLQTVSNYFLLSLSVADFAIGVFSMPLYTVYLLMKRWPLGPYICDTWLAMDYTMSNASVANLLLISFDRYLSVTRPLTYRAKRTPKRAAIMISFAWVISILMWTPWIFAWPYIEGERTVPHEECHIQFLNTNQYITVITAIAAFYLPVMIMCVLYFKIYLETEKRQKGLSKLQANKQCGKGGESKKSTVAESSDDEIMVNLSLRRNDSSPDLEEIVEFNETLQGRNKRQSCWQSCKGCCRIDRDVNDYAEDSSSSDPPGSPAFGGGSSTHQSLSIRRDHSLHGLVHQNGKHQYHPASTRRNSGSGLMIPLITVDSNRSTPTATPSTEITGTFSRHSNLSSSTGMTMSGDEGTRKKDRGDMYTILIKLPDEGSTDPNAKPSIRMISDSEDDPEEALIKDKADGESIPMTNRNRESPIVESEEEDIVSRGQGDTHPANIGGRRLTQSTDTLRMAMQARVAAKLASKVKNQRARRKRQERKQDKKAAKTLSAILLAFVVTWTPYNIFTVIKTFCSTSCIDDTVYAIGYWLCYINSTVNPVCYALCNANFRRTYWRILKCGWGRRRQRPRNIYETSTYMTPR